MSVAAYPEYKDSGVEWVGLMPAYWEVKRLRYCASLVTIKATESDWQIGLENIAGWTGRFVETEAEFAGDGTAFERSDILYGKLRPYLAKVLVAERPGQAVGDFHVLRPRPTIMSAFLARQLLTRELVSRIDGSTHGSKMPRASWETLADINLPVPPLPEQTAIASFLDRETGKIDALVEEQRRLIALLKEKRQAVISHAVTKGLDPYAPMKHSGVEWLGEVPAHWEISPLKWLTPPDRAIMYGIVLPGPDVGKGIPIVKGGDVKPSRLSLDQLCWTTPEIEAPFARARLRPNDIVYSIRGSIGDAELVPDELTDANITQDVARISPVDDANFRWLLSVMRSQPIFVQLEQRSMGAAVRGINIFDLKRAQIPVPPRAEQDAIAAFLDDQLGKLSELRAEAKAATKLLQERRAALISAAVTGKIDVRGMVSIEAVSA